MTDNPRITQIDLAARARAGDREAYDRLFACAVERVHLFVRLRLGPALRGLHDSMDVLQDAYLAAHKGFDKLEWRGDRAFANWLCGIADRRMRQLHDHHGAQKRDAGRPTAELTKVMAQISASGHGVLTSAARREWRDQLEQSLDALDDELREAVALRYFGGMPLEEVAQRMSRSEPAVRRLIGKALRALGGTLRAHGKQP